MNIRKLIIEDVRCFAGRHEFNIRPLTFIVGENSTGKSTALGCYDALHRFIARPDRLETEIDFDADPFRMGGFADIAHKSESSKDCFKIGIEFESNKKSQQLQYLITLKEKNNGFEPEISKQEINSSSGRVVFDSKREIERSRKGERFRHLLDVVESSKAEDGLLFHVKIFGRFASRNIFEVLEFAQYRAGSLHEDMTSEEKDFQEWLEKTWNPNVRRSYIRLKNGVFSFAPIRNKLERTIEPVKSSPTPDGSDVPTALMNISLNDSEEWESLKRQLIEFGNASGLFSDVSVRRLGDSMADPFQLQVRVRGPIVNMFNVGYGVNQIFPILVRILNSKRGVTFMIQQPEVHLHPKGQAELSSLIASLVKQKQQKYIIETHSDYMVDRARIEIIKGRISPKDVSLIYLEPEENSVKVHNIGFDNQGNLIGAPDSYGEFFLKETNSLLGLA